MGDTFLKNLIGFKTDDVFVILSFQEFIKVRQGKGGIPSEVGNASVRMKLPRL